MLKLRVEAVSVLNKDHVLDHPRDAFRLNKHEENTFLIQVNIMLS